MNTHKLAEKIFTDIQGRQNTTMAILRDAKALGKLLGVSDYLWIDNELTGYMGSSIPIPDYRIIDAIERKSWFGTVPAGLLINNSEWLYSTTWIKWGMMNPVSVLEDLVSTGANIETKVILKTLNSGYLKKDIYQKIEVQPREVKKILDFIQDKVQTQIIDYIAQPRLSKPSLGILAIYAELFPNLKEDTAKVTEYLESGTDYLAAARSSRSILIFLSKNLISITKPKKYTFTDGNPLVEFGDKSKMKFYIENKGKSLFRDSKKLLSLEDLYRDIYDMGSKALKDSINIYETNLCLDNLLKFMEQLYRYTDLKPIE